MKLHELLEFIINNIAPNGSFQIEEIVNDIINDNTQFDFEWLDKTNDLIQEHEREIKELKDKIAELEDKDD